jgi:lysozyme
MIYSKVGLRLTEGWEGLRLSAYQDSVGVWTIGYGHTHGVYRGQVITEEEAEALLISDVQWAESQVNALVRTTITQAEFDALVDFVFNLGAGNFAHSTLLSLINRRDFAAAALEFAKWDKAGGKTVAGLLRRRQAEENIFVTP